MQKRYGGPQIVAKLRQADVLIGQGKTVPELCKELEIRRYNRKLWMACMKRAAYPFELNVLRRLK